jgi:hypothetical protein
MANTVVAEFDRIPMSANLAATLSRATDYARAQQHLEVTLEHLLLALIEDPEAGMVLAASRIEAGRLAADVSGHLGRIEARAAPDHPVQLAVSTDLRRILEAAAAAAQQGRRREINGAIVLAAVVGDSRSAAAHMLGAHGMTFEAAIRALQRANAQSAQVAPRASATAPAEVPVPSSAAPPEPATPAAPALTAPPQASPAAPPHVTPAAPPHVTAAAPPRASPGPPTSAEPAEPAGVPAPPVVIAAPETPTGGRPAHPPRMDDLLAEARERVLRRRQGQPEPASSEPERGVTGPSPPAAPQGYAPDWHEPVASPPAPVPSASVPAAPPAERPRMPAAPSPPAAPPSAVPSAAPPRPGVHPHRPLPPDRGARPPGGGPVEPAHPGSWAPPPSGAAAPMPAPGARAPRPSMPPPLPHGGHPSPGHPLGRPPSAADGAAARAEPPPAKRAPVSNEELAADLKRASPPSSSPNSPPSSPPGGPPAQIKPRNAVPGPAVEVGQLIENIPKSMRVAVPQRVEVRIGKADVKALAEGLQGGGAAWRHEVMVTKAMSVRLRAPEGGFYIESASPETQWIESTLGLMSDDFASWRWTVTPRERGWKRLQLVVSARTVGADGLAAETALPDQIIDVKVRTNIGKAALTAASWVAAAVVGGLLAKFGEGAFVAMWHAAVKATIG